MTPKRIVILGVTGSIGQQALDVIRAFPDQFILEGMSGYDNIDALIAIANELKPPYIVVPTNTKRSTLLTALTYTPTVFVGESGLIDIVCIAMDQLIVAIVGTAALPPVIRAIPHVSHIAIANKEVLVAAGPIIMDLVARHQSRLIPIDSEHSALFQCLQAVNFQKKFVKQLTLTASGGPFWQRTPESLMTVTRQEALQHPNWSMGNKITVDSSTMANKGLEVIEAHHLFGMPFDDIHIVIHPKSIVHAFVETIDGAIFSHMGRPDMRYPIQYAMTYPNRLPTPFSQSPITGLSNLAFHPPNYDLFPLLSLAISCGKSGGAAPVVFNAANEATVHQFLREQIDYVDIAPCVDGAVSRFSGESADTIDAIIELDARVKAHIHAS